MPWIINKLWLIPVLPLLAAGVLALAHRRSRNAAVALSVGSMVIGFLLSCAAFCTSVHHPASHGVWREFFNFPWLQIGDSVLELGWVLDPLTAVMLMMVTFVGSLIFIYSIGYMEHDENFTKFFCFLSLFAAAMLGIVIANSLLLLFISWELVGLASYLLIGFWFHKPSAAAAAKKAFITTRIGDIGFFLGILWLYSRSGTLLFYDHGHGCLEQSTLTKLGTATVAGGLAVSTGISLLLFCGAIGKSGQVPLHVWLPDAMEGPTPVSALIHAATMVAAGVFLVARVYPLMSADAAGVIGASPTLAVVTWVGAITAVFAACIAVAQTDIKRILAYSTVSQLGYMMMGLGVGGVAVGMFHLITHAFFKALLFLGSGSVIHGCHEEQDIRRMGGLRKFMPVTFVTYAVGMMALSGVPLFFSGFWSKDEILHSAAGWPSSQWPFFLGLFGALLTAFYMTRQVCYVFFGKYRGGQQAHAHHAKPTHGEEDAKPHESPKVMTMPLVILAVCTVLLSLVGTPMWPWFHHYLAGHAAEAAAEGQEELLLVMLLSSMIALTGIWLGWRVYGQKGIASAEEPDVLAKWQPDIYALLQNKFYVDEFYEMTVIRFNAWWAWACDWMDEWIWNSAVMAVSYVIIGFSWASRLFDEYVINLGFDQGCKEIGQSGKSLAKMQDGQVHTYLRVLGVALTALVLLLAWGCRAS